MSALDDVLMDRFVPEQLPQLQEAREELGLLRDTSFRWAASRLNGQPSDDPTDARARHSLGSSSTRTARVAARGRISMTMWGR